MNLGRPSFSSTPARPVVVCYYKTFLKKKRSYKQLGILDFFPLAESKL